MYKNNLNTVFSCKYHILWYTKYRKKVLLSPIDKVLKQLLFEISHECRCEIIELEIMPDHVHLLVEIDPYYKITQLIKIMKGRTSRFLRHEYKDLSALPGLWTTSCFISTIGGAPLEVVKRYIENQKNVSYAKT